MLIVTSTSWRDSARPGRARPRGRGSACWSGTGADRGANSTGNVHQARGSRAKARWKTRSCSAGCRVSAHEDRSPLSPWRVSPRIGHRYRSPPRPDFGYLTSPLKTGQASRLHSPADYTFYFSLTLGGPTTLERVARDGESPPLIDGSRGGSPPRHFSRQLGDSRSHRPHLIRAIRRVAHVLGSAARRCLPGAALSRPLSA